MNGTTAKKRLIALSAGLLLAIVCYLINPFGADKQVNKTICIALLMISWWVMEAMPMPVVALLPLILHPLLGISTIEEASKAYSNPVIFLFMGGFMIGLAIEKWNLHKRIALKIVQLTGTSGNHIILGFIIATGFLSMWLSNTATTMMMFPIALSVIKVMKEHEQPGANMNHFALVMMLVIAYASNIGGMATIIGTPPNLAFSGFIERKYGYSLQFVDWMLVCLPLAIIMLAAMYFILTRIMFPNRVKKSYSAQQFIRNELHSLGPITKAEKRVLVIFLFTACLWIFKKFVNQIPGINLDDNMIALIGALLLFITPSGSKDEKIDSDFILKWEDTGKMAWGILLLFGGGIALANSLETAGVMKQVGDWLAAFSDVNVVWLILMITIVSIFLSEVMSNVAQVIVLAPVLAALADSLKLDPLLLGIPMTLAASAASMLPMGTPPNAIVFSSGHIRLKDMMKAGLALNILSIILITLFSWWLLPLIMRLVK